MIVAAVAVFAVAARPRPAEQPSGPGAAPLVVETDMVRWRSGYEVTRSFVGRVEARQQSELGFELPGKVSEVLVDEGEVVDAGTAVARLDRARLEARRAELAATRDQARAELELAAATLRRTTGARELNAVSAQALDEADKAHAAAQARLARAEAAIGSIDVDLAKTEIRCPFDAVVAARHVDPGRVVEAGMPIVRVLERSAPEARIGIAGLAIDAVRPGRKVTVSVRGQAVGGTVTSVLPTRDRDGRAVDAIVRLDALLDGIRVGDLARLSITRRVEETGFWAPLRALTEGTRGLWSLYVLDVPSTGDGDAVLLQADVEVVHVEADRAFVRGALEEGRRFAARGLHRFAPGMAVRISATGHELGDSAGGGS